MISRPIVLGFLAQMTAIGALFAVFGPSVLGFRDAFGVDEAAAGTGFAVQSTGAVVGVLCAPVLVRRVGNRTALAVGGVALVAGAIGIATAPTWSLTVSAAALCGLGIGGCDLLITQLLIMGAGAKGPTLVNVAHGFFGIGTVLAPAAAALVDPTDYRLVYAGIALVALGGLTPLRGLQPRPTPADPVPDQHPPAQGRTHHVVGIWVMVGFIGLYVTHFGVQSGIGTWEPLFLESLGHSANSAALLTSGFWLAMVLGRFGAATIVHRVEVSRIVSVSCVAMTAATAAAAVDSIAAPALLVAGFCIGPIFPNGLTWLARSGHGSGSRFAYVLAASMVGTAIPPWLLGLTIHTAGPAVMPVFVTGIALLACLFSFALRPLTRREGMASDASP